MKSPPGPTGTDGRAIQITREGIPTLCLSIPLRYMHTSVEVVDILDIKNTAKLLAFFITTITNTNLEGVIMLLKKLTEASGGVSGNEKEVRNIILDEIQDFVDDIKVDRLGNIIAYKKKEKIIPRN